MGHKEQASRNASPVCGSTDSNDLIAPKILDLADGVATYDERHRRKSPDWTYED